MPNTKSARRGKTKNTRRRADSLSAVDGSGGSSRRLSTDSTSSVSSVGSTRLRSTSDPTRSSSGAISSTATQAVSPDVLRLQQLRPVLRTLRADQIQALQQQLAAVKLTDTVYAALSRAEDESRAGEAAARVRIEQRLIKLGFDLSKTPDLYDRIAARLRQQLPVTINLRTNVIEDVIRAGGYANQWERSSGSGKPVFHGGGKYAIDRNETEKILHGLPELLELGEAASFVTKGWQERNEAAVKQVQAEIDSLAGLEQRLVEAEAAVAKQDAIVARNVEEVASGQFKLLSDGAQESARASYIKAVQQQRDLQQARDQAKQAVADLRGRMPELALKLRRAKLELEAGRNTLTEVRRDESGFLEPRSLPIDRPHSAGVNAAYRSGGAPNPIYGTSHIVLRPEVRARSTLTGVDSLEGVYKKFSSAEAPRHVGTFDNPGTALQDAHDDTLRLLAQEALAPEAPRPHQPGSKDGASAYLEAQVFGTIDIGRDIEKIVVDEDDLDAWERNELVDYFNQKIGARTKASVKQALAEAAARHGFDVQYIRTGRSRDPGGFGALRGPGQHLLARRGPIEERSERVLRALRSRNWKTALAEAAPIANKGGGSLLGPSYSTSGLTQLAAEMKRLEGLAKQSTTHSEAELSVMAADALRAFYESPVAPEHAAELERVLANTVDALRTIIQRSLGADVRALDRGADKADAKPRPTFTTTGATTADTSATEVPAKSPADESRERALADHGVNLDYHYEDLDMDRLLRQALGAAAGVEVLAPLDNIYAHQLRDRLTEAAARMPVGGGTLVIPYNIGNYHWVGLAVEVAADGGGVTVHYMDPLREGSAAPADVRAAVSAAFGADRFGAAAFPATAHNLQSDNHSCGPWTVANLVALVNGNLPAADTIQGLDATAAVRADQRDVLGPIDDAFNVRQRDNTSTVSSTFSLADYLERSSGAALSPREQLRILDTADAIERLGDGVRGWIVAAFDAIAGSPDQEARYHFQLLRQGLRSAYEEAVQGNVAAELQQMQRLLQALWGIDLAAAAALENFADLKFRDYEELLAIGGRLDRKGLDQLRADQDQGAELERRLKAADDREAALSRLDKFIHEQDQMLLAARKSSQKVTQ